MRVLGSENYYVFRRSGDTSVAQPLENKSGGKVPEIGGSSAGFIALVVSLAVIFLISCIGIFILLRGHKRDPFEAHARRVLAGDRQDITYKMPLGPPALRQKVGRLFGFWKKKRDGWVRASSGDDGDEWDASDQPGYNQARELTDRDMRWISDATPTHPRSSVSRSETSDSIALSVPVDSVTPTPASHMSSVPPLDTASAASHSPYKDPFVSSPTSMKFGSTPSLLRDEDERRFSVQSGSSANGAPTVRSMRKFENGTKFKESLEF